MKKWLALFTSLALCAGMLAGCSGNSESPAAEQSTPPAAEEPVAGEDTAPDEEPGADAGTDADTGSDEISGEITYWSSVGSVESRTLDEELIARFNELYPNVTVNYEGMDGESYKTKIKTVVASNNLPDVFTYWVGEQFNSLVSSGNVYDMTEMYAADTAFRDTFVPGSLEAVTIDGKIYGAPTDITCMAVWYNQKIFAEHSIEVPETYEELVQAVADLNDAGVTPIIVGSKDRWPLLGWYAYLAQRLGGVELYEQVTAGDKDFTEEAFIQAGEMLRDLAQTGFINGSLSLDATTADAYFASGQAAMMVSGSWSIPTYTSDPETAGDFAFFPFPQVAGGVSGEDGYLYGGVANTLAISNASSSTAAAEAFVKFYMSEAERTSATERSGGLSTVRTSPNEDNMVPLAYQFNQYVSDGAQGYFAYTDQALKPDESEKLLAALVAIIADDSTDVADELAKIK